MKIPAIGSKVSVTVRHKSIYLYAKTPWDEKTYQGTVVKNPKWIDADSFSVQTEDKSYPVKVIHSGNVHKIQILFGDVQSVEKFKIKGSKGDYIVTKSGSQFSCTCVGFKYHAKCKHITEIKGK